MKQVTKYCLYAMEIGPYSNNRWKSFGCFDTIDEANTWIKDYNSNNHKYKIEAHKLWDND